MISDSEAWGAVQNRDRRFDGQFVTGVLSTGIYCRPSCSARHPQRQNVIFYDSAQEAEEAGLRACKRCAPGDIARDEAALALALQLLRDGLDGVGESVTLGQLAEATGYSATHFQRVFKRAIGMSPSAYGRALRLERASEALSDGASVTDAIYSAGFNAASRFYAASAKGLGMIPSAWREGGAGVTIRWAVVNTSLGELLVATTQKGICRLSFAEGGDDLARLFPRAELIEGGEAFSDLLSQVICAVEQPGDSRTIPLDVQGTAFQQAVWRALQRIPSGETRSYAQIAAAVGKPNAVRATGSANGANPVAVLIPCHRVVRSDGSLGGYAYGLDIKRELLRREQQKA